MGCRVASKAAGGERAGVPWFEAGERGLKDRVQALGESRGQGPSERAAGAAGDGRPAASELQEALKS